MGLLSFIEIALLLYFTVTVFYQFIFSFSGLFYKTPELKNGSPNKIAVLIPSYKEDNVIIDTAKHNLRQTYNASNFDIVVIADKLQKNTIKKLKKLPIVTLPVNFENSTKVKSLKYAFENLENRYDIVVILDADNHMDRDFLSIINKAFNEGDHALQGNRMAKNMNNSFAILDAMSEIINNHIYRKGCQALGFSSAVIGSGMAFEYNLAKDIFQEMDSVGGFDRELQLKVVEKGHRIKYIETAKILDEKVQKAEVFKNQRRRWLSSQYFYLKKYFKSGMSALFNFNFDYFKFAILNNLFLSHIVNFGLLFIVVAFFTLVSTAVPYFIWIFLFCINVLSFILALPLKFYNTDVLKAIFKSPHAFLIMILNLFNLRGANKSFIHTPHTKFK